ncbi:MAG TPA: hypothetical protein VGL13_18245 [Polyangiaceae bacterium]
MRAAAVASEESAGQGALRVLGQAGSAADALIAGFLAAAAERASVLFAPVQMLITGPGVGSRAFDGRSRQPGLGAKRPRGFVSGEPVPPAAQIAVPASLGALALLHAHDARLSLDKLAAHATTRALDTGATIRADVIARFGHSGPSVLGESRVARPLLSLAGPPEGGLLTERDLAEVRPAGDAPQETSLGGDFAAFVVPWAAHHRSYRRSEIIAAVDSRGVLGVLAYAPDDEGITVPELELMLPRDAAIVQRGIERTRPAEPLECAAPIAVIARANRAFLGLGVTASRKLKPESFEQAATEGGLGAAAWLGPALRACRGRAAFGVMAPTAGGDPSGVVLKETE